MASYCVFVRSSRQTFVTPDYLADDRDLDSLSKNATPIHYRRKSDTLESLRAIRRPNREVIVVLSGRGRFNDCYEKLVRSEVLTYVKGKTFRPRSADL